MKIISIVLFLLLLFPVVSVSGDKEDVQLMVDLWGEIFLYVNSSTFNYGLEVNQKHVDYVVDVILGKYGITNPDDYGVFVYGEVDTYKPLIL